MLVQPPKQPAPAAPIKKISFVVDAWANPPGPPCGHTCSLAAETGKHPLRHLLTAAPDATFEPQTTWRPSSTGASQSSRLPIRVRCPGFRAFHQRSMPIPLGVATWPSGPNWSPTSPTRSKITPAEVLARQPGQHRQATRAPPSSAKSRCGGPPTVSSPKTRDQPEESNSKRAPPCGNNASTGTSRVPPAHQDMPRPMSDRQHTPHLVAGTTTTGARTKHPDSARTG